MKVADVVAQVSKMDGKSSDEIKAHLDGLSTLARLTGQGDDLKAIQTMIQTEFKGDARSAVDFLKKHGNDPSIANQNVASFVNSGQASRYVQAKLGTASPAMASTNTPQNIPPPAPPPAAALPVSFNSPGTSAGFPVMQTLLAGLIETGLTAAMNNQKNAGMAPSMMTQALGPDAGVKAVSQAAASVIISMAPKMG